LVVEALKVTAVPAQIVVDDAAMDAVGVTTGLTVITMLFELAIPSLETHVAEETMRANTMSEAFNVLVVKVALFVPCAMPLMYHSYVGVTPPFVGVAVNVTLVPAQMVVALAAIVKIGVTFGVTVMAMLFEFAVAVVTHVPEEVKIAETTSPVTKVLLEKFGLLLPTLDPFTCHCILGVFPP
jgi:hypothetical protein